MLAAHVLFPGFFGWHFNTTFPGMINDNGSRSMQLFYVFSCGLTPPLNHSLTCFHKPQKRFDVVASMFGFTSIHLEGLTCSAPCLVSSLVPNSVRCLRTEAGKHLGLYFSAHWCPPCRAFTPQLAKWYAGVKCLGPGVTGCSTACSAEISEVSEASER